MTTTWVPPGGDTETGQADPERAPGARLRRAAVARGLLLTALAVALVVLVLPRVGGTTWTAIGTAFHQLEPLELAGLTVLWFLGIWSHSFVLAAAMPGLSNRRAIGLNMTGSAVSNVLPLGGAVGVGLNYTMWRAWGFPRAGFAVYTLLTNLWDVAAKLSLPVVALVVLTGSGADVGGRLLVAACVAVPAFLLLVAAVAVTLRSDRAGRVFGRGSSATVNAVLRLVRSRHRVDLTGAVEDARRSTAGLLQTAWPAMTAGMAGYVSLQAVLLWSSLHALGSTLGPGQVLAGFALERLLTLAVVTPGGAGLAETAAVALLVALGGDPATTAAGVLLYRGFTFGIEIPVGGVGIAGWLLARRRAARRRGNRSDQPKRSSFPYFFANR